MINFFFQSVVIFILMLKALVSSEEVVEWLVIFVVKFLHKRELLISLDRLFKSFSALCQKEKEFTQYIF